MSSTVLHDASFSQCEACGELWDAANHAAVAGRHHKQTGHAVVVHTDRAVRIGATPEQRGQAALFPESQEAA